MQTTFVTFFPFFPVTQSLYAFIKEDAADFKLDRIPAHSGWFYQFTVHAPQTRNISTDVMYFVYPANPVHCAKSVTQELSLDDLSCFPQDFFFSSRTYQPHYKKILLLNRGKELPYGIALMELYHYCCRETVTDYFFANVSSDRKLISELILPSNQITGKSGKLSVNLGIKPIFSKYYKTVSFLLTVSLISPPAGNEISSYAAYGKSHTNHYSSKT